MANYQSNLAREVAKTKAESSFWRDALAQKDTVAKQAMEFAQATSNDWFARNLRELQSPAITVARHYQDLLESQSTAMQSVKIWQDAERIQQEYMRRILDPLTEVRKKLLLDQTTDNLVKELTEASSRSSHVSNLIGRATSARSMADLLARLAEDSREQQRRFAECESVAGSIQSYLKDFERINRHWMVPSELLGIVSSFKQIQAQIGEVPLPTIDWGSAGALAKLLGHDGILEQLALLGIQADGTMQILPETQEKGILSRKQSDVVALVSLLMSLLFFIYQENTGKEENAKSEAYRELTATTLHAQAQQIQSLSLLIGQALNQAAQEPKDRFVVRERPANVRAKAEHGSPVEGKLLPNEVVRAINRKGRWVEIEYYHWLHEEYRTGWVLKHYLERVPANYSKNDKN